MPPDLQPCRNPACLRWVKSGTFYCCHGCDLAHAGKYDPDGYHSEMCDHRAAERGERDVREHIAHKPKYTASADDLAALATEAREAATPRKCCATTGGEPHTSECEATWRATRDFPTAGLSTYGTSDPRTQPTDFESWDDVPVRDCYTKAQGQPCGPRHGWVSWLNTFYVCPGSKDGADDA